MIKYIVKADVKEQLAKDYLKRHENISSTLWKKIKRQDEFFVNGQKVRATQAIVKPNDIIEYNLPVTSKVEAIQIPLNIVFEDDYFLVVDKIAGMLTHPLTFENTHTLANGVMYHFAKTNQNVGCHPLYRLDRNTSGLVVFAKMPQLQHQLANNHQKFQRYYYALVHGKLSQKEGQINAPIGRKKDSIILHEVNDEGKHAITNYRVIKEFENYSLIKLWLETGRTHQIRVHMSYLGHPLLGDDLYGGKLDLIARHALHAYKLKFTHPFTHEEICISSPMPDDMAKLIID